VDDFIRELLLENEEFKVELAALTDDLGSNPEDTIAEGE
jgi:hypothetical protein